MVLDSMGHLPCFLYQSIRKGLIFDYARMRATGLRKVGKQKPMDRLRQPFQQGLETFVQRFRLGRQSWSVLGIH